MQNATDEHGRIFREAWIPGVRKHYPGDPKPGYIARWDDTPGWERQAAAAVYAQVRAFVDISGHSTARLTREQKGADHFEPIEGPRGRNPRLPGGAPLLAALWRAGLSGLWLGKISAIRSR